MHMWQLIPVELRYLIFIFTHVCKTVSCQDKKKIVRPAEVRARSSFSRARAVSC